MRVIDRFVVIDHQQAPRSPEVLGPMDEDEAVARRRGLRPTGSAPRMPACRSSS